MRDSALAVLLIEDNAGDVRLIQELLVQEAPRATVGRAAALAEGLARLQRERPDVILLDLSLPDSQGLDTFSRLNAAASALPIVVLTALDDEKVARAAVRQGAQDYLLKGQVTGPLLVRALGYAIERKAIAEERRQARKALEEQVAERTAELRAAVESLRRSEERYALAQQAAKIGSWESDLATGRLEWSAGIEALFGLDPAAVPRTRQAFLRCVHPDDGERVAQALRACVTEGQGYSVEHRIVWPDGTVRWVVETGNRVCDDAGAPRRMVGILQDITERKRLERQMQLTQKLEGLGVLAGGIAHDFNNLLMTILGNVELALDETASEGAIRGHLADIRQATERAAELTQQLLAYSGKGALTTEPVRLNALVEEMSQLLHVSIPEDVVLRYEFAEELPLVEADPTQLRQVVMNLITNAVEAVGEDAGTVTLRTGVLEADRQALRRSYVNAPLDPGRYVFIEVTDTGCGMDEETQARLFDPFFTTKMSGRGLGLAAVLGIVHGHGGYTQVESAPGQGCRFRVLLPAAGHERRPVAAPETRPQAPEDAPAGMVLVVDDDEAVRRLTAAMLEKNGFSVLTAADGEEAVAVFSERADEIAVVIFDLAMPGLDGEEAARQVRSVRPEAPLIFTSGYRQQRADERPGTRSRTAFMQKPFALEDLLAAIRRATGACSQSS